QLRGEADGLRGRRLLLDDLHPQAVLVALEDGELVAVRGERRDRLLGRSRRGDVQLDEPMRDDEVGGMRTEVGTEPGRPALELRQRAREPLPARLRQLDLAAAALAHLEVAEALADEQLLELRLLLEIELLVPELHLVERRHGDVDVAVLE